ncbi:sugar transferase [Phenylobacterium kunshanense]|uniref:Exopolysaccharide biosynthesis protein n=1 Tax=Phenylobacterium kunshanense TaxID=1445034 RepID=A0A328BE12_9CAUL|nr:sugar transferase [Phenylobacterium kunshanense]RAK65363.1 exopolysaccharide biosynthesis protein [Phenylobacterium kunshanense]
MTRAAKIVEVPGGAGASPAPPRVARSRRKRAFDIVVSGLALLAFLPLLVVIGTAIWMESEGPILFRQQRTGLNGRPFRIYKFRTMRVTEDGADLRQAVRGDSRVTPLGSLLRKLSLDELPQLLNVLKGEMSIVGPRPHALAHDQQWSERVPDYAARFRARPGLTGQAQVMGYRGEVANDEGLLKRIEADNAYIDGWTFSRDLALVARTVPLLFGDAQAF